MNLVRYVLNNVLSLLDASGYGPTSFDVDRILSYWQTHKLATLLPVLANGDQNIERRIIWLLKHKSVVSDTIDLLVGVVFSAVPGFANGIAGQLAENAIKNIIAEVIKSHQKSEELDQQTITDAIIDAMKDIDTGTTTINNMLPIITTILQSIKNYSSDSCVQVQRVVRAMEEKSCRVSLLSAQTLFRIC